MRAPRGAFALLQASNREPHRGRRSRLGITGCTRAVALRPCELATRPDSFRRDGSVNPVFVTRQAVRQRGGEIARGLVDSATLGVGQFCTKPGLVFVSDSVDFVTMVNDRIANVAPAPMLTQAIAANYRQRRSEMMGNSTTRATIANASSADESEGSAAVLIIDHEALKESWSVLSEECFGPLMVIVSCDSDSDSVIAAGSW